MNSLLLKALTSLSSTCNKSSLHAVDEDRIKVTFRAIHKNKVPVNPAEIEQWLLSNNWQPKPVESIVTWAKTISSGGKLPLKNKDLVPTEKEVWAKLNP